MTIKILTVVGARPNFMKAAPIIRAINAHNQRHDMKIEHVLLHTGQHYDERMSDAFFADLKLPRPGCLSWKSVPARTHRKPRTS